MNQMNQMNRNYQMQSQRSYAQQSCPCQQRNPLESMNRAQLFNHINEVSFAVEDIILYLDTHPYDSEALAYCNEMVNARTEALEVYSRRFEPLTIDNTDECETNRWEWIMQPWTWEVMSKGGCR